MGNPPFYMNARLSQWIKSEAMSEPKLDCGSCTRAHHDPTHAERWRRYKCCTFQPFIPNYTLGALLNTGRSEWLFDDQNLMFQPIGLVVRAEFRARYSSTPDELRGEAFLCRFYAQASRACTLWSERPSECSTYFCDPQGFARERLSAQMFAVETAVAQMALAEQGFSATEISVQVEELNEGLGQAPTWDLKRLQEIYVRADGFARQVDRNTVNDWLKGAL